MYKLSYVVRVSAESVDELKRRCDEVFDFYDDTNVKLVRPFGDMMGLHEEFLPSSKRYMNDYIQYVTSDFLAGLGFGATQKLGIRRHLLWLQCRYGAECLPETGISFTRGQGFSYQCFGCCVPWFTRWRKIL